mgnify:FL=1
MVFNGSLVGNTNRAKVFIDGIDRTIPGGGTVAATTAVNALDFPIGAFNGNGTYSNFDNAYYDEVSFKDYSMTQTEVTAEYNSGVPTDLMELAAAKQPEHYYRMGDGSDTITTIYDVGATGTNNGAPTNMEAADINGDVPI